MILLSRIADNAATCASIVLLPYGSVTASVSPSVTAVVAGVSAGAAGGPSARWRRKCGNESSGRRGSMGQRSAKRRSWERIVEFCGEVSSRKGRNGEEGRFTRAIVCVLNAS